MLYPLPSETLTLSDVPTVHPVRVHYREVLMVSWSLRWLAQQAQQDAARLRGISRQTMVRSQQIYERTARVLDSARQRRRLQPGAPSASTICTCKALTTGQ
jgi:hypothetical protein